MAEAIFSRKESEARRKERVIDLGADEPKLYFIRKRTVATEKELEVINERQQAIVRENEQIERENAEIEKNRAEGKEERRKPRKFKEVDEPFEDICVMLEDEQGKHPPHDLIAELDVSDIVELRKLIWPEAAGELERLMGTGAANGSSSTPAASSSASSPA